MNNDRLCGALIKYKLVYGVDRQTMAYSHLIPVRGEPPGNGVSLISFDRRFTYWSILFTSPTCDILAASAGLPEPR